MSFTRKLIQANKANIASNKDEISPKLKDLFNYLNSNEFRIQTRKIFNADITIWLDTIESGRFEDTNKMFINPDTFDFRVTEKDSEFWSKKIAKELEEK